jgi:hypothetical protein
LLRGKLTSVIANLYVCDKVTSCNYDTGTLVTTDEGQLRRLGIVRI